jgi:UDP:flavonoid glycosyltransferase YjiC (YdhE family)
VKKILSSPQYRQKAERLKSDIARYDAPTLSAMLLEQLAATKQPVCDRDRLIQNSYFTA